METGGGWVRVVLVLLSRFAVEGWQFAADVPRTFGIGIHFNLRE